jgi:UDP-hydrolysing UDP-N-acetyl-D-glucosamine 2-epimerase
MRSIGLVTTARSDWGIQRPVAAALRARGDVDLHIIAAGMHLRPEFGYTVEQIEADGFAIAHRLDSLVPGDTPHAISGAMGEGVRAFANLFAQWRPDLLTVLGDRFDMFPAAVAAAPFLIPVAHLHGGESTLAAFDDQLRHAITKLAHVHLVATEAYAQRVRQMGEQPHRVHVVGAPGLDDVVNLKPLDDDELAEQFGFDPAGDNLLVVYHPETLAPERVEQRVRALFDALSRFDAHYIIVKPNADTGHGAIVNAIEEFQRTRPDVCAPASIPRRAFLSLLRRSSALVGNSSSGIIEAPSFRTPVVNIGNRQAGRVRAANVIDVAADAGNIAAGIERALSVEFRRSVADLINPYGDGTSGPRIAKILATVPLGRELLVKPFVDL